MAQRAVLSDLFAGVSRFSEMRQALKLFDRNSALAAAASHFGVFGAELLALHQASVLVHGKGVKCVASYGPEMYLVRIPERRRRQVSSLNIEQIVFANGVYASTLVAVLEPKALSGTPAVARLRVVRDRNGYLTFFCAYGRNRYRVDKDGGVYISSVTPRNTGVRLRAPPLTDLNRQNLGRNHFLRYFPDGNFGMGYTLAVKHQREQSSLMVYAHQTVFLENNRVSLEEYTKTDRLSGTRVPDRVYHDQCTNHASRLRFHAWGRRSAMLWSNSWRMCAVARLGQLLFLRYTRGDDRREGVVRIPSLCSRIEEVIPYDGTHVMILCNYLTTAVPLHEDDDDFGSHGRPVNSAWQPVTILAPVTPLPAQTLFRRLQDQWLAADIEREWGARFEPERRDYRHGELKKINAPMYPRLVLPGHFQGRVACGGRAMAVFGDALLVTEALL